MSRAAPAGVLGPSRPEPTELISQLTRLALACDSRAEFRGRALALLSRTLPFDGGAWQEVPPFGEFRVELPRRRRALAEAPQADRRPSASAVVCLELERFGRIRAVLTLEREGGAFGAGDVDWLRTLLPTLVLADEGVARSPGSTRPRPLTPREADVVEYVRLGYTNAQIGLATGRSVSAVRNLLVRVFDKTGVRTRTQLVTGTLAMNGLTRRERDIVEHLRRGLTNREIGLALGISTNTVRNTLARLFDKVGVSTRSELMGALATEDTGTPGTTTW
jgi:DNA-binding CsgD family transcriptional regulator